MTHELKPAAMKAAQEMVEGNTIHDNEDGTAIVSLDGIIGDIASYLSAAKSEPVAVKAKEPDAVTLLRGPLSRRATSAEFNEWQAREVVMYIDTLVRALKYAPSQPHFDILAEAMAEVKASSDGLSDQPIAEIVQGCLDEIAALASEPANG